MAAYVVVDITVTDPETYATYRELAPATVALYGGRYIARGGAAETSRVSCSHKGQRYLCVTPFCCIIGAHTR